MNGGEGGIRTHGTLARTPDFESGTFGHSVTSPKEQNYSGFYEQVGVGSLFFLPQTGRVNKETAIRLA